MDEPASQADLLQELRRLRDHEEIRQMLYRYARGVDRSSATLIASAYAKDGTDKHGPFDGPGTVFAKQVAAGGMQLPDDVGNHHITNVLIQVNGDTAVAETYFLALHPHHDAGVVRMALMSGRYVDQLVREDGRWGVLRREVISDFSRNDVGGEPWAYVEPSADGFAGGRRGAADPSARHLGDLG
jgi:hypothetical protein